MKESLAPVIYDDEEYQHFVTDLGGQVVAEEELFEQIANIDNEEIDSALGFSSVFERYPILLKIAGGMTVFAALTGMNAHKVHRRNESIGRDDSLVNEVIQGVGDTFPVDIIQGLYAPFVGVPDSLAEACLNQSYDLQLVREYTSQKDFSDVLVANIQEATTHEEIIEEVGKFFGENGIKFHYNSVSEPENWSFTERFSTRIPNDYIEGAKFDDTTPESLEVLRNYGVGVIRGLSFFPTGFNRDLIDHVIFTGDVNPRTAASAHDGLRNVATILIELDSYPYKSDIQTIVGTTVHEATHVAQYRIIRENSLYLSKLTESIYKTLTPEDFKYANEGGLSTEDIASANPDYFTHDSSRVFARQYSTSNKYEDGATTVEDLLVGDGLITEDRQDWGSIYHKKQIGWMICYETMMPGFTNFVLASDIARKGIPPTTAQEAYRPYRVQTLEELYESL